MLDRQVDASDHFTEITAEIVSSYVQNNSVSTRDLPDLIASIHSSLRALTAQKPELKAEKPVPHIPVKKTVTPDYLISLEDGRHYKSLKRHLSGRGMTPADYREKWGLSHDYPMVAASYAAKRSELAKRIGLGRKPSVDAAAAPKRGRANKAA